MSLVSSMAAAAVAAVLAAVLAAGPARGADFADGTLARRGNLDNARLVFERTGRGHVAFLGGSITEMEGYRPLVMEDLRARFPRTAFTFTGAGIASTCSTTGAFRLRRDVLDHGPVDLFFVEFAVNDDQDAAHGREACLRGMEGIVRQVRRHNPRADLVLVYFVNPALMDACRRGETPLPIAAHEDVARHYGISTVNVCLEVTKRIDAGRLTWEAFGGVHPGPRGNRLASDLVAALLGTCWAAPAPADARPRDYPMPDRPLDAASYDGGRLVDPKEAKVARGWRVGVPAWDAIKGSKRGRFTALPVLEATEPGAEATLDFRGTAVGAYLLAGPDAGILEAAVDGGPMRPLDLYHRFSQNLHYPRTVLFADGLAPGPHTLRLRLSAEHNPQSTGTAARLMHFAVNETPAP